MVLYMDLQGLIWIYMDLYGFIWIYMDLYELFDDLNRYLMQMDFIESFSSGDQTDQTTKHCQTILGI